MTHPEKKILVTGATGYIGSWVLTQLLQSKNEHIKSSSISVIVRGEEKAKSFSGKGVNVILFNDLDDTDVLEKVGSEHDIVVHTASGFHIPSAVSLIKGLAKRKASQPVGSYEPRFIHTSGTSNLGDQPITGMYHHTPPGRILSDSEDIYTWLKEREAIIEYHQRTTDVAVVEAGVKEGIKTYIIMSPAIYGFVSPYKTSYQFPTTQIRNAIKAGQAEIIDGAENGIWNYVHILDLAELYELFVINFLTSDNDENVKPLPYGEKGIYFSAVNEYVWKEFMQNIADAGYKLGAFKTNEVKKITLEEAANKWENGNKVLTEAGFASTSRSTATLGREILGWVPKHTEEETWKKNFEEEFRGIWEARTKE